MGDTAKSLLELQEELYELERRVALLRHQQWEEERLASPRENEQNKASFYDLGDGKGPSVVAVVYGERIEPPQNGATVRIVVEGRNGWNEYRLKAALVRPHGLDYETRGPLVITSVKRPESLRKRGAVVIVPAALFAGSIKKWEEAKMPIPLSAQIRRAR